MSNANSVKPTSPTLLLSAVRDHRASDVIDGIWEAMWHRQFSPEGEDIYMPPPSESLHDLVEALPCGLDSMSALHELLVEYDELKRRSEGRGG